MSAVTEGTAERNRVLLVDDDDAIRALVRRILVREAFEVELARDGQEAIDCLAKNSYDIILLDLMMPRVDGFGVIDYLRKNSPATLKRVIVMTAFTAATRDRLEPTCRLVAKPFEISDLMATIRTCLSIDIKVADDNGNAPLH